MFGHSIKINKSRASWWSLMLTAWVAHAACSATRLEVQRVGLADNAVCTETGIVTLLVALSFTLAMSCIERPRIHHTKNTNLLRLQGNLRKLQNLQTQSQDNPLSLDLVLAPDAIVPEELVCPLTGGVLVDPVRCNDGNIYERAAITRVYDEAKALRGREPRSPLTRGDLEDPKFLPTDLAMKNQVITWLVQTKLQDPVITQSSGVHPMPRHNTYSPYFALGGALASALLFGKFGYQVATEKFVSFTLMAAAVAYSASENFGAIMAEKRARREQKQAAEEILKLMGARVALEYSFTEQLIRDQLRNSESLARLVLIQDANDTIQMTGALLKGSGTRPIPILLLTTSLERTASQLESMRASCFCPLTGELLEDAVRTESGIVYSRAAIKTFYQGELAEHPLKFPLCPETRRPLGEPSLWQPVTETPTLVVRYKTLQTQLDQCQALIEPTSTSTPRLRG